MDAAARETRTLVDDLPERTWKPDIPERRGSGAVALIAASVLVIAGVVGALLMVTERNDNAYEWTTINRPVPVEGNFTSDTGDSLVRSPSGLVTVYPTLTDQMAIYSAGAWRVEAQPPLCGPRSTWLFERHPTGLVAWTTYTRSDALSDCSTLAVLLDGSINWDDRSPEAIRFEDDSVLVEDQILMGGSGITISVLDGSIGSIPTAPPNVINSEAPTLPVVTDDSLYLADVDDVSSFDLNSDTWTRSDPLPFSSTGPITAAVGPDGLVVVGYDGEAALLTEENHWRQIPDIPIPDREGGFVALAVDDKVVVGRPNSTSSSDDFVVLDGSDGWTRFGGPGQDWSVVTTDGGRLVTISPSSIGTVEIP